MVLPARQCGIENGNISKTLPGITKILLDSRADARELVRSRALVKYISTTGMLCFLQHDKEIDGWIKFRSSARKKIMPWTLMRWVNVEVRVSTGIYNLSVPFRSTCFFRPSTWKREVNRKLDLEHKYLWKRFKICIDQLKKKQSFLDNDSFHIHSFSCTRHQLNFLCFFFLALFAK